jgi:hypothetical protein
MYVGAVLIGLLILIAIGSWQIHILNKGKDECKKGEFDHLVNGVYLGNGTVRYIEHRQYKYCTTEAQGLLKDQLVEAYVNSLNKCQLTPTNCESYINKVVGWGFGLGFAILLVLVIGGSLCE